MGESDWDLLSSYAGLLSLAILSIYSGAFESLPKSPRKSTDLAASEEDEEDSEIPDRLSTEDAWLFPVFGSVALLGMFLIIKYFGKEWINYVLGWYFSVMGVGSVWKSMASLAKFVVGKSRWTKFDNNKLLFTKGSKELVSLSLRTPALLLFPLATLPSILYKISSPNQKSVLMTNILSMSFSHNSLSLLKIDSFKTGCILLSGLFFYDIWWVFGTQVMVSVATGLDVPIKLQWPKSMAFSSDRGFTMLGLGDIVIPGVFIAFALRYDYERHRKESSNAAFPKPYFYAALGAYISGLITTIAVMHNFKAAQPALLYLSPACILSFFITATARGELKEAWNWSDEPPKVIGSVVGSKSTMTAAEVVADPNASVANNKPKKKKIQKKTD